MNAGLCFVVIGAGQAGGWAARTLRDQSFAGRIVLIGDESHPPHERPPLSKSVLMGEKPAAITHLFPAETFSQLRIDCRVGRRALAIDRAAHTVTLDNGECLNFDRLLLATGGRARHLSIPGTNLPGIHVLRTIEHSLALAAELQPGRHILVIGGGWIGLEVAAAARKKGAAVTVVETLDRLCARAVTPEMSNFLHNLHEQHGVVLKLGQSVTRFEGTTHVKGASLSDGSLVNCDAAVIGIGLILNVELASQASLAVDNGIVVDGLGRTSDSDIFAAGDVANQPSARLGRRIRLESWENAQNQAINTARAMLDKAEQPYDEVPWFWSDQFGVNVQLLGLPENWDRVVTRGSLDRPPALSLYLRGGRINGAIAINSGRDIRFVRRAMTANMIVDCDALANPAAKLQDLLKPS